MRDGGEGMARPKRLELLTPRFVVWCSIQLSYGRRARGATLAKGRWGCKDGWGPVSARSWPRLGARRDGAFRLCGTTGTARNRPRIRLGIGIPFRYYLDNSRG